MRELEHCHGAGPWSCHATCLDVCAGCFPSVAAERRNRIFHSLSVLVEQIPYGRCLQCQKNKPTSICHCSELSSFLQSQWSWSLPLSWQLLCLRVVPKHPRFITSNDVGDEVGVVFSLFLKLSRQQFGIPFDHCSAVLAQILMHCAQCWDHLTKFAGTFHMIVWQCCKHHESFVFGCLG